MRNLIKAYPKTKTAGEAERLLDPAAEREKRAAQLLGLAKIVLRGNPQAGRRRLEELVNDETVLHPGLRTASFAYWLRFPPQPAGSVTFVLGRGGPKHAFKLGIDLAIGEVGPGGGAGRAG